MKNPWQSSFPCQDSHKLSSGNSNDCSLIFKCATLTWSYNTPWVLSLAAKDTSSTASLHLEHIFWMLNQNNLELHLQCMYGNECTTPNSFRMKNPDIYQQQRIKIIIRRNLSSPEPRITRLDTTCVFSSSWFWFFHQVRYQSHFSSCFALICQLYPTL